MPFAPLSIDLEQQKPASLGSAEDVGEFVVIDDVPIFDAHTGDDGTEYDERLLGCIAENMNRRIVDTGDWCPLVIGHTPEDPSSDKDPEVVGFSGPYKIGMFGNKRPKPCIFAKFWVWKDKQQKFRDHPRRSVELWPENSPEERFFDPIALLGAETPRRALGLAYAKAGRQTVYRYELGASAPSGTNTFLPDGDLRRYDKREEYEPELNLDDFMQRFAKRFADEFADLDDDQAAERIGRLDEEDRAIVDRYFAAHCDDAELCERYARACGGYTEDEAPAGPMSHAQTVAAELYQREADEWRRRFYSSRLARLKLDREIYELRRATSAANRNARFEQRHADAMNLAHQGADLDAEDQLDLAWEHRNVSDRDWKEVLARVKYERPRKPAPHPPAFSAASTPANPQSDRQAAERERLAEEAMKIAFRYQQDPKRRRIGFPAILKHLIENGGRLDEPTLTG